MPRAKHRVQPQPTTVPAESQPRRQPTYPLLIVRVSTNGYIVQPPVPEAGAEKGAINFTGDLWVARDKTELGHVVARLIEAAPEAVRVDRRPLPTIVPDEPARPAEEPGAA